MSRPRRIGLLLLLAATLAGPLRAGIVINEIMYNTPGEDVEYVELFNTGPGPENLHGWYLLDDDDSHTRCALAGSLAPGDYLVVAGDLALFGAEYPGVPVNVNAFSSDLPDIGFGYGNTGDEVRLFDSTDTLIDIVAYQDTSPWPPEADGGGPSLELFNPELDNGLASSWGASAAGPFPGSPGSQNTNFVANPGPLIGAVSRDPELPESSDLVTITATVTDETGVSVANLWLDLGAGFSMRTMLDNGTHGDETADDAVFSALISPRPAGTVIRYYVTATDDQPLTTTFPPAAPDEFFAYTVDHRPPPIAISEIMAANQNGIVDGLGDREDWLEIWNPGPDPVDLGGRFLSDDLSQPQMWELPGVVLQPGARALIWCDAEEFQGPFHASFRLARFGGELGLFESVEHGNVLIDGFTFGPQNIDVAFGFMPDGSDAREYLGTPTPLASNDTAGYFSAVGINEFLADSQLPGIPDWIELHNRTGNPADISGWQLSDDAANPEKYAFPPGTILPPFGHLSVDENSLGFGLAADGSEVLLLTDTDPANGRDYFDYGPQLSDITQGRFPDGTSNWHFFTPSTQAFQNDCDLGAGPLDAITDLRFDSRTALSWDDPGGAETYDALRGDLATLRATEGDFDAALVGCVANNLPQARLYAPSFPGAGGLFYLIRGANFSCRFGTYDSGADSQVETRDGEIAAFPGVCP